MTPFGLADADYWRSLFPGVQARVEQKAQITSRQPYVTTGGESISQRVSQSASVFDGEALQANSTVPCLLQKRLYR